MNAPAPQLGPLAALARRYDRMAARGEAPVPGFAPAQISFVLVLSADGRIVAVHDERSGEGKKKRPKVVEAPQAPKRTVAVVSGLFWDKTSYVLGATRIDPAAAAERQARDAARCVKEHEAFKAHQREVLAGSDDFGAQALIAFLDRWQPEAYGALDYADDMLDQNVAFRLESDRESVLLHQRPALHALAAGQASTTGAERGQCLLTGATAPIARLHPSIKGVPGAQSSGASIVSFNASAFTSYGKDQGDNAPVSEAAAFAYGTALNELLAATKGRDAKDRQRWRNRVQIGDATAVFWVEAEDELAAEGDALVGGFFDDPPRPAAEVEAEQSVKVQDVLRQLEEGRPLREAAARLADMRVYILGVSPNAARLSVRFWHVGTLGDLAARFQEHWDDMRLEPGLSERRPAMWRLLSQLAAQGEAKNIPAHLAGEFTRAIVTGGRYPRTLLVQALMRIRADGNVAPLRVALIKACLAREFRKSISRKDVPVSLDPSEEDVGYRLGRLFAVMEAAQQQAIPGINASIRDRFYGSASATPGHIFPLLLRGVQDHLSKIHKTKRGLAIKYEKMIAEVMDGLSSRIPPALEMDDQGRFAIGYYHQRNAIYAKRVEGEATLEQIAENAADEGDDQ